MERPPTARHPRGGPGPDSERAGSLLVGTPPRMLRLPFVSTRLRSVRHCTRRAARLGRDMLSGREGRATFQHVPVPGLLTQMERRAALDSRAGRRCDIRVRVRRRRLRRGRCSATVVELSLPGLGERAPVLRRQRVAACGDPAAVGRGRSSGCS